MEADLPAVTQPIGSYRGRLAPSPTGYLHIGHGRTFWIAQERARNHGGTLVLRSEDLDKSRCRPEFVRAMIEDLRWLGLNWHEGPDRGGPYGPYEQSRRKPLYASALEKLKRSGCVYPCVCSRKDVLRSLNAPHAHEEEPIYPGTCRNRTAAELNSGADKRVNWRFRVPDGEVISFTDGYSGPQEFTAGRDFGDFVVFRGDELPSYQLAVVVDDSAMKISEVVRGEDLLISTARQLLLYRALGLQPPAFYHCPLVASSDGRRLAKRDDAASVQSMKLKGMTPEAVRGLWERSLASDDLPTSHTQA